MVSHSKLPSHVSVADSGTDHQIVGEILVLNPLGLLGHDNRMTINLSDTVSQVVGQFPHIVINLSGVSHMDQAGLYSMLNLHRLAEEKVTNLVFSSPNTQVMNKFHLSKIDSLVTIFDTEQEAVVSFGASAANEVEAQPARTLWNELSVYGATGRDKPDSTFTH